MEAINNILGSELLATGLSTIVQGSIIHAPASCIGNFLEGMYESPTAQTVAKIFQSTTSAILAVWATMSLTEAMEIDVYDGHLMTGALVLVLCMPLIFKGAEKLFPNHRETIENIQRNYSTVLKVVNLFAAAVAFFWFASLAFEYECAGYALLALMNAASVISSAYSLHRGFATLPA